MTLANSQCLYVFVILYGGIILTLFFRAFDRKRLLSDYVRLKGEPPTAGVPNRIIRAFLTVPRQMQALRQLGKSISEVSNSVRRRYRRFRMLTFIAIILIVLLGIFSIVAHKICV